MNEIHIMDGRSRIARKREVLTSSWTGTAPVPVLYNLEEKACRSSFLGNTCFSLAATGGDYSREEYFPFGETSFRDFGKERYRFCGKERDEESGLYYNGARYYACWSSRFVSVDPLAGEMPFATPYSYAGNSPVGLVDVDGLAPGGGGGGISSSDSGCQPESSTNPPTRQIAREHHLSSNGWYVTGVSLSNEGNHYQLLNLEPINGQTYELVGNSEGQLVAIRSLNRLEINPTAGQGFWSGVGGFVKDLLWMNLGPVGIIYDTLVALHSGVVNDDWSKMEGMVVDHVLILTGPFKEMLHGYQATDTLVTGDEYDRSKLLTQEGLNFLLNLATIGLGGGSAKSSTPKFKNVPLPEWKGPADYSHLRDPKTMGPGKDFTAKQKKLAMEENIRHNDGFFRSDLDGSLISRPTQAKKGSKANMRHGEGDHRIAKSKGGTNSFSNFQWLSKEQNLK